MKAFLGVLLSTAIYMAISPCAFAIEPASDFYRSGKWRIHGGGPHYLDVGLGAFDINGDGDSKNSGFARMELRLGKKIFFIGPAAGFLANFEGAFFAYGGIYADISYGKLIVTPAFGAGVYERGEGKDLGGSLQFRSSLGLSYEFDDLSRLGIHLAHISNADLHESNPGEQDLLFTMSIPFEF